MKTTTFVQKQFVRLMAMIGVVIFTGTANLSVRAAELTDGATLTIPSLGIQAPIVEAHRMVTASGFLTWDVSNLGMNTGHLENSGWINIPYNGNIVIAGHSTFPNGKPSVFFQFRSDCERGTDYSVPKWKQLSFCGHGQTYCGCFGHQCRRSER